MREKGEGEIGCLRYRGGDGGEGGFKCKDME